MHTEISPWVEKLKPHRLTIGAVALLLVLLVALIWVAWRWGVAEDRMEIMQRQAEAGFLQAPSSNRTVRVDAAGTAGHRDAASSGFPERIDVLFNARTKQYARFRMSLLRNDGTLLMHADQMVRDSNFDLRFSFNTSILPAGEYVLRVEGYARGGKLERFAEARLQVAGR